MTADWLPDVLALTFMQRALVGSVAVCAVAPVVGMFVVQRQQSLLGEGMGHVAFAGVGGAFLLGIDPVIGALGLALLGAYALYRLQRGGLSGDVSLALLFYGGLAVGYVFATRSGIGLNALMGFLFGQPLAMTWSEVATVVALCVVAAVLLTVVYPSLLAVAFDEAAARVAGVRVDLLVLTMTLVVALIVVGGMVVVGVLLVAAMMIIPVAAASQVASSYRSTMIVASGVGTCSALAGLLLAYYADLTASGAIVLVAIGFYVLAKLASRLRTDGREISPATVGS